MWKSFIREMTQIGTLRVLPNGRCAGAVFNKVIFVVLASENRIAQTHNWTVVWKHDLIGLYDKDVLVPYVIFQSPAAALLFGHQPNVRTRDHFSATFIGSRSQKESRSVSVFWHTSVYMALRRRTLPRQYNGPLTCLHVVIFGLPQRRLWSSLWPVVQHLATEHFLWLPHASRTLPSLLRAVQSLTTFRRRLKAERFT